MYRTFKDEKNVYFMLEFVEGMELFDVIREIGYLNNFESKFYVGSMILAIEYLHFKNIIYRDLKPENIMIDTNGYLKMIDLGTAKVLKPNNGVCRTATLLGTPHYMAPEIFEKKGYSFNVDLWSIGVCLFEFMVGYLPFGDDCEDPFEVYQVVVTSQLSFPHSFLKPENRKAKSIMEQLLSRTPERRLGGSFAALKAHQWFDDFDWDKLLDKDIKAPFLPKKGLSEKDISRAERDMRFVTSQLAETPEKKAFKKPGKSDLNWDKDF
jgi:cGMP-dependent protein kinase